MLATAPESPSRSKTPIMVSQARSLAVILREEFGETFTFYDLTTGQPISEGLAEKPSSSRSSYKPEQIKQFAVLTQAQALYVQEGRYQLLFPLCLKDTPPLLAVGFLVGCARSPSEAALEQSRLQKWARSVCERLTSANTTQTQHRRSPEPEGAGNLAWEAISAMEQLTRRLRVHKDFEKHQKRILRTAAEQIRVQALVWVPQQNDDAVQIWGESGLSPWDCRQLSHRLLRTPELGKAGFLVLNDVQSTSLGAGYPQLHNLLILSHRDHGSQGLLLAINKRHSPSLSSGAVAQPQQENTAESVRPSHVPFRRTDVVLLTPFAALFSLYVGASGSYQELKELLVGLVRSLTAAIDAKDAYTFGHSERVGRIAAELAREVGLEADEVSDLYLAGLLHDVGKIGIRDEVLCKKGSLTPEEREHLQQHVIIGHAILIELHPIRHLLPGVLFHHERYDGAGYPEGLKGEAIPIIARILAVADAYDAMSTTRPYRQAMPQDRIETILREGAGTQWDKNIIDAFFRCREKIHAIRQRGIGESLRLAVNGALRKDEGGSRDSMLSDFPSSHGHLQLTPHAS